MTRLQQLAHKVKELSSQVDALHQRIAELRRESRDVLTATRTTYEKLREVREEIVELEAFAEDRLEYTARAAGSHYLRLPWEYSRRNVARDTDPGGGKLRRA